MTTKKHGVNTKADRFEKLYGISEMRIILPELDLLVLAAADHGSGDQGKEDLSGLKTHERRSCPLWYLV
ncbi:MAG: hypothetical protein J5I65_15170 [Aridibacter famidurans]|nr:hypothetical protein [Aridibacter famidurans]